MSELRGGSKIGGRPILGRAGQSGYIGKIKGNTIDNSLIYDDGTNIGIGTDAPAYPVHIKKNGAGEALYVQNTGSGDYVARFFNSGDASELAFQGDHVFSNKNFHVGNATELYLRGSSIGINTTTPISGADITMEGVAYADDLWVGSNALDGARLQWSSAAATYGFSNAPQHSNATILSNEQGSTNQVLLLGDNDTGSNNTIFGIANSVAGGAWTPIIDVRANSDVYGINNLYLTGNIDKTGGILQVTADQMQVQTSYGHTKIGAVNGTYSHFYTDLPGYYFDKSITLNSNTPAGGTKSDLVLKSGTDSTNTRHGIEFIGGTNTEARIMSGNFGGYNGGLIFETRNDNVSGSVTSEHMRITNQGNVGIGTSTPSSKLHVDGNARVDGAIGIGRAATDVLTIEPGGGANIKFGSYNYIGNEYSSHTFTFGRNAKVKTDYTVGTQVAITSPNGYEYIKLAGSGGIQFHAKSGSVTGGDTAYNEVMRITQDGDLGIGTTAPSEKLHVAGSAYVSDGLIVGGGVNSHTIKVGTYATFSQGYSNGNTIIGSNIKAAANGTKEVILTNTTGAAALEFNYNGFGFYSTKGSVTAGNTLNNEVARITHDGKLGLGISPIYTLSMGDADTGFNWNSDGNFSIHANSVEVANITSGLLHVKQNLTTDQTLTADRVSVIRSTPGYGVTTGDADTGLYWNGDGDFELRANSASVARILPSSMTFKKPVYLEGDTEIQRKLIIDRSRYAGSIRFQEAGDDNHVLWNSYYGNDPNTRGVSGSGWDGMNWRTYRGLKLYTGSAGGTTAMVIDHSGVPSSPGDGQYIGLYGGGTETLRVSDDQKVGIGTIAPTEKLDVNGSIAVTGTVDGVDIAAFKSAYDSHNHDGDYVNTTGDTMSGRLTIDNSSANPLVVKRSASSVNAGIEFQHSGGSVYAGHGGAGLFEVSNTADLSAAKFSVNGATGDVFLNGITASGIIATSGTITSDGNITAGTGASNTGNITLDVSNAGSPQISMHDSNDNYWAIGADDADNNFSIHGSTSGMTTLNGISNPHFEITTGGVLKASGNTIWHAGNDGSGSGLDADKLDGLDSSQFLRSDTNDTMTGSLTVNNTVDVNGILYADRYIQPAHGKPSSNLGSPTITEMALFENQFTNKTWFYDPTALTFEYTNDGTTWIDMTPDATTIKKFLSGNNNTSINIPNLCQEFRITVNNAGPYVYLNALYMYWSSQSHNSQVHIDIKKFDDQIWYSHANSIDTVSAWPGHLYLPFSTVAFRSSAGGYDAVRIIFKPNWSGDVTYGDRPIALYGMEIWGGYPTGTRKIYSWDENKNVTFPEELKADTFRNSSGAEVAYSGHTHAISDITNLQSTLDSKLPNNGTWTGGTGSTHTILAGSFKSTSGNTKFTFYGDGGKMDVVADGEFYANEGASKVFHEGHKPTWSEIDSKPSTFTPSSHSHVIADVTGLQSVLDGKSDSGHNHDGTYLPIGGKAVDADKLDGIDSSQFLRSDVEDVKTGVLRVNTNNGVDGLYIQRNTRTDNEYVHHFVNDGVYAQHYKNDEASSKFQWTLENTDTEANGGASASTHTLIFDTTNLKVDNNQVFHEGHLPTWDEVTGKPSTFTPSLHTHAWGEITGKPTNFEYTSNKGIANGYAGLDSNAKVPLSQLPDASKQQTHVVADTAARNALTGLISGDKAFETSTGDSYIYDGAAWQLMADADWQNVALEWNNISGKPTTFTPSSHTHAWTEITGKPSTFTPSAHTHAIADVTGLQTALDGKASSGHDHSGVYLPINGKAADANLLDGINSSQFLRSDVDDILYGNLRISRTASGTTGYKHHHLELYIDGSAATENAFIKFHQGGKWWHRIEATNTGFYFRTGDSASDSLSKIFALDGNFDNVIEGGTALSSKYLGINAKAVDSDKLDGKDSTAFLRHNGQYSSTTTDWNTLGTGIYNISNGTSGFDNAYGQPTGAYGWGTLVDFQTEASGRLQIYAPHHGTGSGSVDEDNMSYAVYIRTGWNTDWKTWRALSLKGHTHAIADVTGLQSALDSKLDNSFGEVPAAPTNLVLTEIEDEVQVQFDFSSSSSVTEYEIWSSIGTNDNYGLVGVVTKEEILQTDTNVVILDGSYSSKSTIYYKVYAKNKGIRSAALTGSIVIANTVADPINMTVTAGITSYTVQYEVPDDHRLDHVEIKVHASDTLAGLSEASATLAYSGLSDTFVYEIPTADLDKYHQFWVSSITRS